MNVTSSENSSENRNRLQAAFQQTAVGIVHASLDGRLLEVNGRVCEITGYSRDELLARTFLQVSPPDDVPRHLDTIRKFVAGEIETYSAEEKCIHKQGQLVPVNISATMVRECGTQEPRYFVALIDEIPKYTRAEQLLATAHEMYSEAFRQSPVAIAVSSARDHRYLAVNEAFEHHTGYKREQIIGRTAAEIGMWVDPSQRLRIIERLLAGDPIHADEYSFRLRDGSVRTCLGSAELIEIDGEPCLIAAAFDITDRKRAGEMLHEFSGRLMDAQEAERKRISQELGDVVGQSVSLLAVQLGHLARRSRGQRRHDLEKLHLKAQHIASDLSVVSQALYPSLLGYVGLPRAIGDLCREVAKAYGLKVTFKHKAVPARLGSDVALSVYRIAQELLQNAALHSGTRQAWLELLGSANSIRLTIRDKGVGFDVDSVKSGVGLLTMRERCRVLKGELVIHSQPGETRIEVRLPLRRTGDKTPA